MQPVCYQLQWALNYDIGLLCIGYNNCYTLSASFINTIYHIFAKQSCYVSFIHEHAFSIIDHDRCSLNNRQTLCIWYVKFCKEVIISAEKSSINSPNQLWFLSFNNVINYHYLSWGIRSESQSRNGAFV